MDPQTLADRAAQLATNAQKLAGEAALMAKDVTQMAFSASAGDLDPFMFGLTVFVLAVFVGYHVVWRVTPALHSPLMAVTNAISSVIIVGALIAAGPRDFNFSKIMGFFAVVLAAINIFGGFVVTQRMLEKFKRKAK